MSSIQTNVGLITGIPIQDTVDQLLAVSARPRDTLQARTDTLAAEQSAIDQVSSLLLGFRFSATQLQRQSNYTAREATSSDSAILSVATTSDPPPQAGVYSYTPLQLASTHQVASNSFTDVASQLTSGTLRIGIGGHVDKGITLHQLNAGLGVKAGSIRITDRSGATAEIDLRTATTIDEVLNAINTNGSVNVEASTVGDAIHLADNSGGTGSLRVDEVGFGSTAAGLGLAGISVAADQATGSDILTLHDGALLSTLNDGNGVRLRPEVADLEVTLADDTTLSIDLGDARTLGQVVDAINAADETKLSASISADGNRLELTDLTSGATTFSVESAGVGTAAEDLGLTNAAAGNTITGSRLISGLQDTLLSSLQGGQGFEGLGTIDITDRSGASASVDLSIAGTLGEVVTLINALGPDVTASINSSRNGIVITDNSGGGGNLTIANGDATNSADALGIAVDDAVSSINSGSLNRQTVSEATLLEDLNSGDGVDLADFRITDSAGNSSIVSLNDPGQEAENVGDVIDAINALSIGVEARINDTGDGILIVDTADGQDVLTVAEVGSGSAASDLKLLGSSTATDDEDQQIIDGSSSISIDVAELTGSTSVPLSSLKNGNGITLGTFAITNSEGETFAVQLDKPGEEAFTVQDVIDKINAAAGDSGVTAAITAAGTGIELKDTSGGSGTLSVRDLGSNGTTAAQLGLDREANTSGTTQTITSHGLFSARDESQNALDALAEAINDANAGFSANTFFDGVGFRISISSDTTGAASELLIDSGDTALTFDDISRAEDAVLQVGSSNTGGIVITNSTNQFDQVTAGLELTVQNVSSTPITVEVAQDDSPFLDAAQNFVDSFNSLRTTLDELTIFDQETLTTGLLFGRSEILRVESELSRLFVRAFETNSDIGSFQEIGISLNSQGQLELNNSRLKRAFEEDPQNVQRFFSGERIGVVDRVQAVVDQLAGDETSLLAARSDAIGQKIESNEERLIRFDDRLDRERTRLLTEFFNLEQTIALLQTNLSALDSFQPVQPVSASRSSG